MPDAFHECGSDLLLGPTGGLALADGSTLGEQRVLRRLLTNPFDYIWHIDYGAGLPQFVGQPARLQRIRAVARTQMRKEHAVAKSPAPTVDVTGSVDGTVYAHIRYVDRQTGVTAVLNVPLEGS